MIEEEVKILLAEPHLMDDGGGDNQQQDKREGVHLRAIIWFGGRTDRFGEEWIKGTEQTQLFYAASSVQSSAMNHFLSIFRL